VTIQLQDDVFATVPGGLELMPREILIQGGHVVTVDPGVGDFVEGDVLVSNSVIADVGPQLAAPTPDAEVIDARGHLVIPGLVDTPRHVWHGAIGGFTPQMTGAGYEPAVLRSIAPRHTPDDIYAGTRLGALQALDAGTWTGER
jgi:5-methylthioadenosine/S-adenosylhomocysteine deaminase